jgi:hypothetical protein
MEYNQYFLTKYFGCSASITLATGHSATDTFSFIGLSSKKQFNYTDFQLQLQNCSNKLKSPKRTFVKNNNSNGVELHFVLSGRLWTLLEVMQLIKEICHITSF